ncbi:hypothetical protein VD0002_g1566 [Verticillium dahliae]|uniref:Uncharacterized protein n=1 Tax=Verticillium dahliae TaxID=27337 RepID=A0A444SAG3_VERDA|nr:hypothetical protein BJF96_g4893 [Verticillium dahliae]PNH43558.1 hypothetical protein VD0004_g3932 [Verticillium dahliae]PNH68476.1 hypothetical protein VD0002_g1566 [Verticillium dahliae]RXG50409.1 hypothetical protein VDGE_30604 [Verticillium dahliae]
MRGILPGRPRSGLQALATGFWGSRQYTVYITGNAFAILDGPEQLVQTVYDEDEAALLAPFESTSLWDTQRTHSSGDCSRRS